MIKNNIEIKNLSDYPVKVRDCFEMIDIFKDQFGLAVNELSVSFLNDKEMTLINRDHLSHDGSTDVISFDYRESKSSKEIDAEIIISAERADLQAEEYSVSFENEVARLLFHGLLHIAGYNDDNAEEKNEMTKLENSLLHKWESSA